jgi:hypothetical protein
MTVDSLIASRTRGRRKEHSEFGDPAKLKKIL